MTDRVFLFYKNMKFLNLLIILIIFNANNIYAQPTIGLLQQGVNDQPGYVLFAPISYNKTYLIDKCGYQVHSWPSAYKPGNSVYFLPDGNLLRTGNTQNLTFNGGGNGGIIEKINWNGFVIWSYLVSNTQQLQHHDICPMPNGNILIIAWEAKGRTAAINAGRDTNKLGNNFWGEKIMEIQPTGINTGNIVWEWHIWDHLIQNFDSTKMNFGNIIQHPELLNINYDNNGVANPDWLHLNAIDYNSVLDEIILSSRFNCEVWIIDHSTTTAEAASHSGGNHNKGGDFLFRWGNPAAYNRGTTTDQKFYGQHGAHWIPEGLKDAGSIMVFNNGTGRPDGDYSTVEIIKPITDNTGNYLLGSQNTFIPDTAAWTYKAPIPTDFYSMNISGAQRLSNGNTLICSGASGLFFEIDSLKNIIWQYKCPVNGTGPVSQGSTIFINNVFKSPLYEANYPGFSNHTLISGQPIELNPLPYVCPAITEFTNNTVENNSLNIYLNPTDGNFILDGLIPGQITYINISDASGKIVYSEKINTQEKNHTLGCNLSKGLYLIYIKNDLKSLTKKLIIY